MPIRQFSDQPAFGWQSPRSSSQPVPMEDVGYGSHRASKSKQSQKPVPMEGVEYTSVQNVKPTAPSNVKSQGVSKKVLKEAPQPAIPKKTSSCSERS